MDVVGRPVPGVVLDSSAVAIAGDPAATEVAGPVGDAARAVEEGEIAGEAEGIATGVRAVVAPPTAR